MKNQRNFFSQPWQHRYSYGGQLRNKRKGRTARPLSTKVPIHLVFKADKKNMRNGFRSRQGFLICHEVIQRYAEKFSVKVEQLAICNDHIHLLVRLSRRSLGQHFIRVTAGQIAQRLDSLGFRVTDTQDLWMRRPFTRVVVGGWRAIQVARDYVLLNAKEASGKIKYSKRRLSGLTQKEWEILWS